MLLIQLKNTIQSVINITFRASCDAKYARLACNIDRRAQFFSGRIINSSSDLEPVTSITKRQSSESTSAIIHDIIPSSTSYCVQHIQYNTIQ